MDVARSRKCLAQVIYREVRVCTQIEDDFFTPCNEIDLFWQALHAISRHDNGTVHVSVNDVIMGGLHAKHVHSFAEIDNMNVGMAGANAPANNLEVFCRGCEVAK